MALFAFYADIFHNTIINRVVEIVLLFLGIMGTSVEIQKVKGDGVKGINNLVMGVIISAPLIFLIIKLDILWVDIICFVGLLFGMFGLMQGIIQVIYSLQIKIRISSNKKIEKVQIIAIITEIIAFIGAIVQLLIGLKG